MFRVRPLELSPAQAGLHQCAPGAAQPRRHRVAEDRGPVLLRGRPEDPEGRGTVHHRVRGQGARQRPREEVHPGGDWLLLAMVGGQGRVHEERDQEPRGGRAARVHWRGLEHERRGGDPLHLHH